MRCRNDHPTEAPPGQGLGTRAVIAEDAKGKVPENRDPGTEALEGSPATGLRVQVENGPFDRRRSNQKTKDNADVSRPCLLLSWPQHALNCARGSRRR